MQGAMRWAGSALGMLVMAGCAANPRANGVAEEAAFVHVVVENERERPDFLRVVLVPASGSEVVLGITTLGTDTLVARGHLPAGRYSLRAEGGTGGITRSSTLYLRGGDTVWWNLRDHTVRQAP